ncbi:helix-turn-helix domain-containing protein [Amycolatopsis methanolica 239]|uniref:Helix-turn-helix domain-containing protein n=1 Tax=Amycolatopsis methanolica 239 TaxID=1068978 RepID=A0A076MZE7_AMYME|nr:helix-turn-helix domain-containing protein [Amycolatopsis methanolica 239]
MRLEQARGLRPSADVVDALAQALRLAPDERTYLFDLTRQRPREAGEPAIAAAPQLARLVEDLAPLPAMLMNHRYDILAWNGEMAKLLLVFDTLPPSQRNAMWLCVLHPKTRELYVDRERVVREGIAHLRAAWAAASGRPGADGPDHRMHEARRGLRAVVGGAGRQGRRPRPQGGAASRSRGHRPAIRNAPPLRDAEQLLVIYRPADDESRSALERLSRL